MERVQKAFDEIEKAILYIGSNEEIPTENRALLVPVLRSLVDAEGAWRLFLLNGAVKGIPLP